MISKSPKPLAAMSPKPWGVAGLWGALPAPGAGVSPPRDLPLERLRDFDHSCFATLENHRKATEATAKENSALEQRRETQRNPHATSPLPLALSSQLQIIYWGKEAEDN